MRRELSYQAARHAEVVTELQAQIDAKELLLSERPVHVVERNLDAETVRQAETERDAAYSNRDSAFEALSELRLLHGDRGSGHCRCGLRLDRCETVKIVGSYPALQRWEAKQAGFLRSHSSRHQCRLPQGHPARTNPKWTPEV